MFNMRCFPAATLALDVHMQGDFPCWSPYHCETRSGWSVSGEHLPQSLDQWLPPLSPASASWRRNRFQVTARRHEQPVRHVFIQAALLDRALQLPVSASVALVRSLFYRLVTLCCA